VHISANNFVSFHVDILSSVCVVLELCTCCVCFPEMEELADHGVTLPPNMQGLTDEQIEELKLTDEWGERCQPSGGHVEKKDEIGRRNGMGKSQVFGTFSLSK